MASKREWIKDHRESIDAAAVKRQRAKIEKQRAKDAAERKKELERLSYFWKAGFSRDEEGDPLPAYELSCINGTSYLRIKNEDTAETNQGAEVPIEHCRRAWPIIQRIVKSGKEWRSNGHTIKLGHFSIDSISADGMVKAGCHTFNYSELQRFAAVLGLE